MWKNGRIFLLWALCLTANAFAQVKTEPVPYSTQDASMEGYFAYDDASTQPKPGILIVHDYMGLGPFAQAKAEQLAKEGYVAFAVDIYGKGIRPKNAEEAGQFAQTYKEDRHKLRDHIQAAYHKFLTYPQVDPNKIVVIGYCFGGTAALELARSGAKLVGTVSFHGGLSNPTPEDAKQIHGRVLAFHGGDDPYVPPKEVQAFKQEMKNANIPLEFIVYPGVVHAFTNPSAGDNKKAGAAYDKHADKASWQRFKQFLKEVFAKS